MRGAGRHSRNGQGGPGTTPKGPRAQRGLQRYLQPLGPEVAKQWQTRDRGRPEILRAGRVGRALAAEGWDVFSGRLIGGGGSSYCARGSLISAG